MEVLEGCSTLEDIENALDDLPITLDETYERLLREIWRTNAKKAQNILTWLLFSERSLTLKEVADAAVVRPGDPPLSSRSRLLYPGDVLRICRSLITVAAEYQSIKGRARVVGFAHFSVKEYLVSGRSAIFTMSPIQSHQFIADCYVSMLLCFDQLKLEQEGLDNHDLVEDNQLLPYAAESWSFHIRQLQEGPLIRSYRLIDRVPGSDNIHPWMEISHPTRYIFCLIYSQPGKSLPPLFYSAHLGLVDATHHFIQAGSEVNEHVFELGTALHMAAEEGHCRIVEILLHSGADVEGFIVEGDTPLSRAVNGGHEFECVVHLLLEHGAKVNHSVIDVAARGGHDALVRLLLEHGACADDGIKVAARRGHMKVVRLLLEYGACTDIGIKIAAREGHEEIVRLLLERGAHADHGIGFAAKEGHETIVRLLLEYGASMDYGIEIAAREEHEEIVRLLLECGAYANYSIGFAAREGHETIVRLLLGYRASVNYDHAETDEYAQSVQLTLHHAVREGHYEVFECLLEHGASIWIAEGGGRQNTLLPAAVQGGELRIVSRLLELGMGIDDPCIAYDPLHPDDLVPYGTALQYASYKLRHG